MLVDLESKGVRLAVNGGKLVVDTDQPLTDEQRQFIWEHKARLLDELDRKPTIESMRATQPPGWVWWRYELANGGTGSIRGPFPDEPAAYAALWQEFSQDVIKLAPLGIKRETDAVSNGQADNSRADHG